MDISRLREAEVWYRLIAHFLCGYANPQEAVRVHCKSCRPLGVSETLTPGLDPQMAIIPERDLYRLIMRSKLPTAERFEEWVVGDVLPTIRKTGGPDMNQVIPFVYGESPVRVINRDGEPWFVGKDVAEMLGYADPTNAMKQHCKGVVKLHPLQTAGGMQKVRILSESDVLRLIVKSSLPSAERFERWIFEDVLPTIRKTGSYDGEMDWREDHRRASSGEQFLMVTSAAMGHAVSRQWKGYWQHHH